MPRRQVLQNTRRHDLMFQGLLLSSFIDFRSPVSRRKLLLKSGHQGRLSTRDPLPKFIRVNFAVPSRILLQHPGQHYGMFLWIILPTLFHLRITMSGGELLCECKHIRAMRLWIILSCRVVCKKSMSRWKLLQDPGHKNHMRRWVLLPRRVDFRIPVPCR